MSRDIKVAYARIATAPKSERSLSKYNPLRILPGLKSLMTFGSTTNTGPSVPVSTSVETDALSSDRVFSLSAATLNKQGQAVGLIYCPTIERLAQLYPDIYEFINSAEAKAALERKGVSRDEYRTVLKLLCALHLQYQGSAKDEAERVLLLRPMMRSSKDAAIQLYDEDATRNNLHSLLDKVYTVLVYAGYRLPGVVDDDNIHQCYKPINKTGLSCFIEQTTITVPDPARKSYFARNFPIFAMTLATMTALANTALAAASLRAGSPYAATILGYYLAASLAWVDNLTDVQSFKSAMRGLANKFAMRYGKRWGKDKKDHPISLKSILKIMLFAPIFIFGGLLRSFTEFGVARRFVPNVFHLFKDIMPLAAATALTSLLTAVSSLAAATLPLLTVSGLAVIWINFSIVDKRKSLDEAWQKYTENPSCKNLDEVTNPLLSVGTIAWKYNDFLGKSGPDSLKSQLPTRVNNAWKARARARTS